VEARYAAPRDAWIEIFEPSSALGVLQAHGHTPKSAVTKEAKNF
jgi:hypothetical protein